MADRAKVTSVEALEQFRAALVLFASKARPVLEEVADSVSRTRAWLQDERRPFWQEQVRRQHRKVQEAQAELFSAKISAFQDSTQLQAMAVQKAKAALAEAEARLARVRRWERDFDHQAETLARQVEPMTTFLASDVAKAIAMLGQMIQSLEAYASVALPAAPAATMGGSDDGGVPTLAAEAPAPPAEPGEPTAPAAETPPTPQP
jgi:hypothetical protein